MADAPKALRMSECENFIKQIRDVISVNIVANDSREIEEIHVLAEDTRNAKQIVRDIETLFRVEYGLDLDHKKVSIVQLKKEQNSFQSKRLKFTSIQYSFRDNRMEVSVELASPKKSCQGQAAGINSRSNRLRLVGEAALQAVGSFLPEICHATLDDIVLYSLNGRDLVAATVVYIQGSLEETLVGSALVRQDEKEAAVKAVLSALNRRIPLDV